MPFSFRQRQLALDSLQKNPPQVIVVGGGVVGSSIAAHTAMLGMNVLLVDRDDFASGTSGASTGLAHAGLRYLAQGRVGYVWKESRERQRLQSLAPHWVHPFDFTFPVYAGDPFPLSMVRLGTGIYDAMGWLDALLSGRPQARRHNTLSSADVIRRFPGLKTEGLEGATEYFVDAQLLDSRFTLGFCQKAAAHGARILNHVTVETIDIQKNETRLVLGDRLTLRQFTVQAPLVINAAGPWIDELRVKAGFPSPILRNSKGAHLVVRRLADQPLILSTQVRGQVFFVLPVGDQASLVGTTDTHYEGKVDEAKLESTDIKELIDKLVYFFPTLKKTGETQDAFYQRYRKDEVLSTYWGLRPLLRRAGSTVGASREHAIWRDTPGFWSIPGVKLTAGRVVGEEVAQRAWRSVQRTTAKKIAFGVLPGGECAEFEEYVESLRIALGPHGWSRAAIDYLARQYGTRALDVVALATKDPSLRQPVVEGHPWVLAEARYAVEEEMVLTLSDLLTRRTRWARLHRFTDQELAAIATVLKEGLQWTEEQKLEQIAHYRTETHDPLH